MARRAATKSTKATSAQTKKEAARQARFAVYESMPKRDWSEMSGRRNQVLDEQTKRWGIPLKGRTLSLPAIAKWLHDFLAEHGQQLAVLRDIGDDNGEGANAKTRKLEADAVLQKQKAELAKLDLAERRGELVPRDEIHAGLARLSAFIRGAGERLQQEYGTNAQEILDEALEDFSREIEASVGSADNNSSG